MSESEKTEKKGIGRDIALLLIGALVGLASSIIVSKMQIDAQRAQYLVDKRIELVRTQSRSYNERIRSLMMADIRLLKLADGLLKGSKSYRAKFFLEIDAMVRDIGAFSSSIAPDHIELVTLFGPMDSKNKANGLPLPIDDLIDFIEVDASIEILVAENYSREAIENFIDTLKTHLGVIEESAAKQNEFYQDLAAKCRG